MCGPLPCFVPPRPTGRYRQTRFARRPSAHPRDAQRWWAALFTCSTPTECQPPALPKMTPGSAGMLEAVESSPCLRFRALQVPAESRKSPGSCALLVAPGHGGGTDRNVPARATGGHSGSQSVHHLPRLHRQAPSVDRDSSLSTTLASWWPVRARLRGQCLSVTTIGSDHAQVPMDGDTFVGPAETRRTMGQRDLCRLALSTLVITRSARALRRLFLASAHGAGRFCTPGSRH